MTELITQMIQIDIPTQTDVDPFQMPHNAASAQRLHGLPRIR